MLHLILRSDLREAVTRLRSAEVNVVSGVLKLYFRELPEPLIPPELFHSLAKMLGKITLLQLRPRYLRPCRPGNVLSAPGVFIPPPQTSRRSNPASCPWCLSSSPALNPTGTPFSTSCTTCKGPTTKPARRVCSAGFLLKFALIAPQSLRESGQQQDVSHEPGDSVWPQPLTPPGGWKGA